MAEATNGPLYEILKQIQGDIAELKSGQRETNLALTAIRTHMVAQQQDVTNIYSAMVRHEGRLERIERRLEISEAPA